MPVRKLTTSALKTLEVLDGKRTDYFDDALPGFVVRVSPTGRKSFCVLYRHGRRLRRYTLGRFPVLHLKEARALARSALAEAALGGDPGLEKLDQRRAGTFAELAAGYLERYAKPNKKSWREDQRIIDHELLPRFKHHLAKDIRRADVRSLLEEIVRLPAGFHHWGTPTGSWPSSASSTTGPCLRTWPRTTRAADSPAPPGSAGATTCSPKRTFVVYGGL